MLLKMYQLSIRRNNVQTKTMTWFERRLKVLRFAFGAKPNLRNLTPGISFVIILQERKAPNLNNTHHFMVIGLAKFFVYRLKL